MPVVITREYLDDLNLPGSTNSNKRYGNVKFAGTCTIWSGLHLRSVEMLAVNVYVYRKFNGIHRGIKGKRKIYDEYS